MRQLSQYIFALLLMLGCTGASAAQPQGKAPLPETLKEGSQSAEAPHLGERFQRQPVYVGDLLPVSPLSSPQPEGGGVHALADAVALQGAWQFVARWWPETMPPTAGYSAYEGDEIDHYEVHSEDFIWSQSRKATAAIKARIELNRARQANVEESLNSLGKSIALMMNPLTLLACWIGLAWFTGSGRAKTASKGSSELSGMEEDEIRTRCFGIWAFALWSALALGVGAATTLGEDLDRFHPNWVTLPQEAEALHQAELKQAELASQPATPATWPLVRPDGPSKDEGSSSDEPEPIVGASKSFRGFDCTDDCSGHEAGYEWANDRGISRTSECIGNSRSFEEGCRAYVEENGGY